MDLCGAVVELLVFEDFGEKVFDWLLYKNVMSNGLNKYKL